MEPVNGPVVYFDHCVTPGHVRWTSTGRNIYRYVPYVSHASGRLRSFVFLGIAPETGDRRFRNTFKFISRVISVDPFICRRPTATSGQLRARLSLIVTTHFGVEVTRPATNARTNNKNSFRSKSTTSPSPHVWLVCWFLKRNPIPANEVFGVDEARKQAFASVSTLTLVFPTYTVARFNVRFPHGIGITTFHHRGNQV